MLRRPRAALPVLLAGLLVASLGWAFRDLPWHLLDVWWQLGGAEPLLQEISIDLTVAAPIEAPSAAGQPGLFVAVLSWRAGEFPFYLGLQTDLQRPGASRSLGPGALFSRWGEVAEGDAQPADGAVGGVVRGHTSDGHQYATVRKPWPWGRGTTTHTLTERDGWVAYTLFDHQTGIRHPVGRLRFGAGLRLHGNPASFVEYYGRGQPTRWPAGTVRLGNLLVNQAIQAQGARLIHPPDVPRLAKGETGAGGVTVHFGGASAPDL